MSFKFSALFLFISLSLFAIGQNDICTSEEVIEAYCPSEKFHKAHTLLSEKKQTEAFPLLKELLAEAKETENKELEVYVSFIEGQLHFSNKSYSKSIALFERVITTNTFSEDLNFYALINVGNMYFSKFDKFDLGLTYYDKARALIFDNSCIEKQITVYTTLANNNLIRQNYEDAELYYRKTLDLNRASNNYTDAAINYNNLGNLYFEQYQDEKAKGYFLKALNTLKDKDSTNINIRQQFYYNLFAVYQASKDYKQSLGYLEKSNALKDSIWNRDKVWEIAEIEKKFAVSEKQKEVTVLEAENEVKVAQRNGFLFSAVVLFLLLCAGIYFYKEKVKSNKIITLQKESLDELNATKDKLFSIVSHDLRSSVNALKNSNKALIDNLKAKNVDKLDALLSTNSGIVNGAYNLLDNLLNWALLQTKQSYFNIEEHRLFFIVEHVAYNYQALMADKQIEFQNWVSKKDKVLVDQESLKIILRNLIDNAIKFTEPSGKISIYSHNEDVDYCHLIVEDSGLGMSESTIKELLKDTNLLSKKQNEDIIGTGLGTQLCKSMIKKNNGKFSIESELGKGTKMIVSLPKAPDNG